MHHREPEEQENISTELRYQEAETSDFSNADSFFDHLAATENCRQRASRRISISFVAF
jgi:hypothetical protein